MFEFEKIVIEKNLYYNNHLIVKYTIEYPRILSNLYCYNINKFNNYNQIKAMELKLYAERELFENAKEVYDYNTANNLPFFPYELVYSYTITYNKNSIISLYFDEYVYASGAHGSTTRTSQTWNMNKGSQIPLCSVFNNDCTYIILILREILHQIETQIEDGTGAYFDNYAKLVIDNFRFDQFYLVDNDMAIYYQQYDIAPYSSGIPVFYVHTKITDKS